MSYFTERLTNVTNPAVVFRAKLREMMIAHPAWEFVEEYENTTTAKTYEVYKNLGTANSWGQDFFFTTSWTTSSPNTGIMYMGGSERYDLSTHKAMYALYSPYSNVAASQANDYTRHPLSTQHAPGTTGSSDLNQYLYSQFSATDMTYWIVLTESSVTLKTSVSNAYGVHVGVFKPYWDHPYEFPLYCLQIGQSDGRNGGSVSRRPGSTSTGSYNWAIHGYSQKAGYGMAVENCEGTPVGQLPSVTDVKYASGVAMGSPPRLRMYESTDGDVRGVMSHVLCFNQNSAVVVGDTLNVDGKLWVLLDTDGVRGMWFNTQQAAV